MVGSFLINPDIFKNLIKLQKSRMTVEDAENTSKSKRKRSSSVESDNEDEEGGIRVGDIYIPPPSKPFCSNAIGTARLVIEKIVNRDFKSYGGVQVVGPFHKCFTSIMGPNGSGKSNVIDSMLFVFGYRASRIRSARVSHLVFNAGGEGVRSCCVAVHFKQIIDIDDTNFEDVPNSSFSISRTGFTDNSSYYELNCKRVHFREVEKLLKQHGIDLDHNRFLILQGEVEQIAMMHPKGLNDSDTGMLEYLEDIIGTTRFKQPLAQLTVHLEKLTEERIEKVQQVRIVEKERMDMKVPYEEAIEYLKTENDITQLRNIKCQKYIYDTDLVLKEKKETRKEIATKLDEINSNIEETFKARKDKEDTLASEMTKKKELLTTRAQFKETYDRLNKDDAQLQADMIDANKRRKANQKSIKEDEEKLTELEKLPEKNKKEIEEIAEKLVELEEQKEVLEQQKTEALEIVARETKPLQTKRQELETDLVSLNQAMESAKAEFKMAEYELEVYVKTEKDQESALDKINEAYHQCKASFDEQQMVMEKMKKIIPVTEAELRKAETDLSAAQQQEGVITRKIDSIRNKLEESRSNMQREHFSSRVVSAIMKQKAEGHLPGVLGRLGDLGGIDAKYDVAISTACGALDHIVVDNKETASACIKYLSDNNIGRQSFLALNMQDHLLAKANTQIQTPENALRLFDLVRYTDQRLKPAFYFALRDTLVADDLTQASRIAYGERRFRVVTLLGEIIELVGTISGGGRMQIKGRMGQRATVNTNLNDSVDTDRLRDLQAQLEQLSDQLNTVRDDQVSLQQSIFELTNKLRDYKFQYSKSKMEFEALLKQLPNLKRQQQKQEENVANSKCDPEEIKQFETIIKTKKKAFEEATAIADRIKVQVDKVKEEIKSKSQTGGGFKQIQTKLNEKKKLIEKLKQESTKLEVGIKTSVRNVAKTKERLQNLGVDVKSAEDTIMKLKDKRDKIEINANKLLKQIEKLESDLLEFSENDGAEDKKEIAKLIEKENKLKAENIDVEHRLSTIDTAIKDVNNQLDLWKRKLGELSLHKIPTNEVALARYEDDGTGKPHESALRNARASASVEIEKLAVLTEEELKATKLDDVHYSITVKQDVLKQKNPNLNIIPEYRRVQTKYCNRVQEVEEISAKRQEARNIIDKVKRTRENEFSTGFQIINLKLKEMYQMITLGGDAELELVDSLDAFHEGVSFVVRPPKKTWKNISNLSGGEKTLSSLALVFALHYYKPSPLYVMDEIDAALDFKNVSIVGNYIKNQTKNAQFIIISLRANMFELADRLIGIYKTDNRTKCVPINPRLFTDFFPKDPNQQDPTSQLQVTQHQSSILPSQVSRTQPQSSILPSQVSTTLPQSSTFEAQPQLPTYNGQPKPSTSNAQPQPSTLNGQPQPSTSNGQPQPLTSDAQPQPLTSQAQHSDKNGTEVQTRSETPEEPDLSNVNQNLLPDK